MKGCAGLDMTWRLNSNNKSSLGVLPDFPFFHSSCPISFLLWWNVQCRGKNVVMKVKRRRQWHPTPVLLPGKSHGWRSLVDCSPWGREELDTTERLHFHALEKEMATHSSVLAWRISGMGETGGLLSMGRTESDTTGAT